MGSWVGGPRHRVAVVYGRCIAVGHTAVGASETKGRELRCAQDMVRRTDFEAVHRMSCEMEDLRMEID